MFVSPRAQVWLDLFVPRTDLRLDLDVSRAAGFVGELFGKYSLGHLGIRDGARGLLGLARYLAVVAIMVLFRAWSGRGDARRQKTCWAEPAPIASGCLVFHDGLCRGRPG